MKVRHLNCISSCPLGGHLMDAGHEHVWERGHLTNHSLLVEDRYQLVLVDTGFGLEEVRNPKTRLSKFFLEQLKPDFRDEMTAIRQIEGLGYDPRDVRHIVLTHLDFDHAGGLDDFPHAKVHMMKIERDYALLQKTWLDRQRFRPQQWSTQANWLTYEPNLGESWYGFEKVRALQGISNDIVMIPLPGHTFGHAGIGVWNGGKWLLDAGDAYFFFKEMDDEHPYCPPGLRAYQWMMDKDHEARFENQERLRRLHREHFWDVDLFCSHDVREFERFAGHSPSIPAERMLNPLPRISKEASA